MLFIEIIKFRLSKNRKRAKSAKTFGPAHDKRLYNTVGKMNHDVHLNYYKNQSHTTRIIVKATVINSPLKS